MRWEGSDQRKYKGTRQRVPSLPIPGRIIIGSLAIAAIILAFISNPPRLTGDLPKAVPDAKPTAVAAAIVAVPTAAPSAPTRTPAPSAVATAAPAGTTGGRVHEVAAGDTLSTIAKKYYNDASKWNKILDANKDTLKNADSLQLGQKLKIPD